MPRIFLQRTIVVATLLLTASLSQQSAGQSSDLSPFSVMRLDASARAAALGGSFGSAPGQDVNAFFYNPAALNSSMSGNLALTYLNHVGDLNAGFAVYGYDVEGIATFAGALRYLSWGTVQGTDESGNETSTFGASDIVLSIGAATEYADGVRLGGTLHGMFSSMEDHRATAFGADAGVVWSPGDARTAVGLSVHNLGFVTSNFGVTDDRLPVDLRLNVSHRLQHLPLLLSITGSHLQDPGSGRDDLTGVSSALRHLAFGGEFQFSDAFNVRFGYNHRRHQDLKMNARLDLAGVGMGFGLKVHRFYLDYAFNSWSTLGGLHQLTIRTRV